MKDLQIEINLILPYGTSIFDLNKTGEAWANILCDRTMALTSDFLKKNHNQPCTSVLPFGLKDTRKFIEELGKLVNKDFFFYIDKKEKEMLSKWEEISAGKLKRKSICIFGDLTTAAGLAKIFKEDINCKLNFVGTFNDYKNLFHEQVKGLCENILVTDNSKKVWEMIKKQNPDIILGTLNEKYLASELGIPFIRISLPPQHITTTVFPSETLMGYTGLDILLDKISYLIE